MATLCRLGFGRKPGGDVTDASIGGEGKLEAILTNQEQRQVAKRMEPAGPFTNSDSTLINDLEMLFNSKYLQLK